MFTANDVHLRLHNWVCLVKEAIRSEVPDYEIMQTMSTFLSNLEVNKFGDDVVKRMAKFFEVNPVPCLKYPKSLAIVTTVIFFSQRTLPFPPTKDELVIQLGRVLPLARGLQQRDKMKPLDAWCKAVTWFQTGQVSSS